MGKARQFLLVITFVLAGPLCYSQSSVKVSDPRLEMVGNTIHISYDILNSDPEEKYAISIVIKDEDGNIINARALDGDIGEEVSGGTNKQIAWNLEADHIFIDAFIFVQIHATFIAPPEPVVAEPEEEPVRGDQKEAFKEEPVQEESSSKEPPVDSRTSEFNRTGIIFQSIALPGLGLSRVTGKPHWIRGVAGYGCLAGSIILGRQAVNTYKDIEDLVNFDDINTTYDKALQQNRTANILLFATAGIWITDFIWTLAGTSDLNKIPYAAELRGFSMGGNIDPLTNIPMVNVRYRF